MMGWMGNYDDRGRPAKFIPVDGADELVAPKNAFQPDAGGGYGAPSVTGRRHDQVAREAPAWFKTAVEAICAAGGGTAVLARQVGTAGRYRFWSAPAGVRTPAEWEAATAVAVAAFEAARAKQAAETAAADAAWRDKRVADERAAAERAAAERGCTLAWSDGRAVLVDQHGIESGHFWSLDRSDWMPGQRADIDEREFPALASVLAAEDERIAAARAAKASKRAAPAGLLTGQTPFAALAALKGVSHA